MRSRDWCSKLSYGGRDVDNSEECRANLEAQLLV